MKYFNFFAILIIFLNFSNYGFAENNYSSTKLMIRFKTNIRENQQEMKKFENLTKGELKPILQNSFSIKYNPKNYFSFQSQNLNYLEIQKAEEPVLRTFILNFSEEINPKTMCKYLKENFSDIEFAEPYHIYPIQAFTPNDKLFSLQSTLERIKAADAWEVWKGSPNTVIGISDNGCNQDHEDITGNITINNKEIPDNNIDDDNNGYIDDYNGYNFAGSNDANDWGNTFNSSIDHGTLVSGIAGASFNNNLGVAGIGGYCKIFPIRAAGTTSSILYGYESIIFAANHHFSVLNMSWGGPQTYSEMEQSIINYAVANGVALVASGGNIGTNGGTRYDTYYPAGYKGVLGVGEVDEWDQITEFNSCMSSGVRILAPGEGNYSTNNIGSYSPVSTGTSFAAPIVSGAVALARSLHPELTPQQSIEFVRLCTDNVLAENFAYGDKPLVPGRINLYKVVSVDPFSIPSIFPMEYRWYNTNNELTNRFVQGDTVRLKIKVMNYLGKATNLKFKLSIGYDPTKSVEILQSNSELALLNSMESADIDNFILRIAKTNPNRIILRLDIEADNNFKDFVKFDFIPTANFATFETDKIAFSMTDEGNFGFMEFGKNKEGAGFTIKGIGNQLYGNSGLIISEDSKKLVTFFNNNFSNVKPFLKPNPNICILNDDYTPTDNKIGLEITQEVSFPHPNVAQITFTTQNKSNTTLKDLSMGFYYDWDIAEDADSNVAELYKEINDSELYHYFTALGSEIVYKPNTNIYVGCTAFSEEYNSVPEIAGLDYSFTSDFTDAKQIEVLNSGMTLQNDKIYDRSVFTGIRFNGDFAPNEKKKFGILVGGNTSRDELTGNIIAALTANKVEDKSNYSDYVKIITHKESNLIRIKINNLSETNFDISFYDISGQLISSILQDFDSSNGLCYTYILPEMAPQIIFIKLKSSLHNITEKALWVN